MKVPVSEVVVLDQLSARCPKCKGALEPRMLMIPWRNESGRLNYYHTNVMYCGPCEVATILSLFKTVIDQKGHEWTVVRHPYLSRDIEYPSSRKRMVTSQATTKKSTAVSKAHTHQKTEKNKSIKPVRHGNEADSFLSEQSPHSARKRPIISNGSPRSRNRSPLYDSSGRFLGSSRRTREDYD